MMALFFTASILLLLAGHLFRLLRWEQFISIYERPSSGYLLNAMAGGYAINFLLPFHLGDIFRAVFSGRKMRSGIGFGFATVIMDRFLDVWFVTLFFWIFRLSGISSTSDSAGERYLVLSIILITAFLLVILLRDPLKKICLSVSGLFNDNIKLDVLMFLWSLINTFKDLRRVNLIRLFANTVLMWAAYLGSYAAIARCLSSGGSGKNVYDVFSLLFGTKEITQTTFSVAAGMGSGANRIVLISWLIVPVVAMFLITLLPRKAKDAMSSVAGTGEPSEYENLLPQLDPNDRSVFLSKYFGLKDKEYLEKFLEINRNISIIQDYSAGSNATTMLCMDSSGTFFRKYAFGEDGEKLSEQLEWLKTYSTSLPLCVIIRGGTEKNCCWYDMEYDPSATDFFRFIHSKPVDISIAVLHDIVDTLRSKLYSMTETESRNNLENYIESKIYSNLAKIQESRVLKELLSFDKLYINGSEYRNLPELGQLLEHERLLEIFSNDPVSPIHGDLTIENIICCSDADNSWYLIDPNTGNIHNSPFLDYAKLLQSLHGSYEFMMMTPRCSVAENHINFQLTRSAAYDSILSDFRSYITEIYGADAYRSILMHEVVHWLRLMPYKILKDKKRAPMFYAGLIMVANDAAKEFGI
ncbi:MAG: lysylphosphatidylglycerol synthase transmembrane domain-containing protein [Eubacteriales bacterium]|nr:lysylphosphatidylglycerol synthase transmembrane domain-containing protein [Eubacteriales bacterium]